MDFDRGAEDPNAKYYLDSQAIKVGSNWSAKNIEIGKGAADAGHPTSILAVPLPTAFVNWLLQMANINNGIPKSGLPPGTHCGPYRVTRSSDVRPCPR